MALREIVQWPDARLSAVCAEVELGDPEIAELAQDMLETMYAAPGRGLAAPQVGVLKRLFVMDTGWKDGPRNAVVCINPRILWRSDRLVTGQEGCLSIPGVTAEVERAEVIRLAWTGLSGVSLDAHLTGFAAICAQHELDHLDGIVTFDRLSTEARKVIEAQYEGLSPA